MIPCSMSSLDLLASTYRTAQQDQSPIILITTPSCTEVLPFNRLGNYVRAVQVAGGIPLLLPSSGIESFEFLELCSGIILTGGGDINPKLFGDEPHPLTYGVDEQRDALEVAIAQCALAHDIPILGICRGLQILAVACGGKLFTNLSDYFAGITHWLETPGQVHPTEHQVTVEPGSRLAHIAQTRQFSTPSWHHCSVKTVPPGWQAVAYAEDGVIEAIESGTHPFALGVQFHPELSNQPEHRQIFKDFVRAARC